jgi:hypothetical protein
MTAQVKTIQSLTQTLTEIKPELTDTLLRQIISEMFTQEVDPETCEDIIRPLCENLVNNPDFETMFDWADINTYLNNIYSLEDKPNTGLDGVSFLLSRNYDEAETTMFNRRLKKALAPYGTKKVYREKTGTNTSIILNQKLEIIQYEWDNGKKGERNLETVINAYPQEVIIHDSPLDDIGRTFTIRWVSKTSSRVFETNRKTIKEIEQYLEEAGWVITPRRLKGTLAAVIQIAVKYKLAQMHNEIDNPGVYWDKTNEELKIIHLDVDEPSQDEVNEALNVIDLLAPFFKGHETKLSTCLKWGLMSIFDYSIKQIGGKWMPWLYLYGKAGSGKTTLGEIILFIYDIPNEDNNLGGSSFDTVARVGSRVSQFTKPIMVSEPEGALNKPSIVGMLKTAIESTTARGRYQGKAYRTIPSFSCGIITANQGLPSGDALFRRFTSILFSHNEKKAADNKKEFDEIFKINSPKRSILNKLKALGNYFITEIKSNPELLLNDWQETADLLVGRAYLDTGHDMPSWILDWHKTETLDDLDEEEIEEIRLFLIEKINRATQKVQVWSEETGRPLNQQDLDTDFKTNDDFNDRVWSVLNEKLIPWLDLHRGRDGTINVVCSSGIKKELKQITSSSYNLQSISELLGWEYKPILINGKTKRMMIVNYHDFLDFLYPKLDEYDGEGNFEVIR